MLNEYSGKVFRALGLALAVLALLVSGTSSAQESKRPAPRPPSWNAVSVGLEDESGRPLQTFMHQGRTFVLGEFGNRYNIRIRNPMNERVEVVVSVDGRDVIDGGVADFVQNRGYVVGPHDSLVIEGFRTSLNEVAAFRFTDPHDSYSSRRGTPQNVGVVGVAFFGERRARPLAARPASPHDDSRRTKKSSAPQDGRAQNLGTEFGEAKMSRVREVRFERASPSRPSRVISMNYDDAAGLEARGIDVFGHLRRVAAPEPEPFPRNRFAPPPPAR